MDTFRDESFYERVLVFFKNLCYKFNNLKDKIGKIINTK